MVQRWLSCFSSMWSKGLPFALLIGIMGGGLSQTGFAASKTSVPPVSSSAPIEEVAHPDQADREQTSQQPSQLSSSDGVPRGRSSGLPVPRFVSLNTKKAYIRRGPDNYQTIDWIYQREGMPLEIVDEFEHWRKVRDYEGTEGWIHKRLLSSRRTAMVMKDQVDIKSSPTQTAKVSAKLEKGVMMKIKRCNDTWCEVENPHFRGWILKSALWGVFASEYLDG